MYKNLATKSRLQSSYYDKRAHHELGMAMHAVMDSTIPAHRGFQMWDGDASKHGPESIFGFHRHHTVEGVSSLQNEALLNETLDLMDSIYSAES